MVGLLGGRRSDGVGWLVCMPWMAGLLGSGVGGLDALKPVWEGAQWQVGWLVWEGVDAVLWGHL